MPLKFYENNYFSCTFGIQMYHLFRDVPERDTDEKVQQEVEVVRDLASEEVRSYTL